MFSLYALDVPRLFGFVSLIANAGVARVSLLAARMGLYAMTGLDGTGLLDAFSA